VALLQALEVLAELRDAVALLPVRAAQAVVARVFRERLRQDARAEVRPESAQPLVLSAWPGLAVRPQASLRLEALPVEAAVPVPLRLLFSG
jgi:hypothetical protein